MGSGNPPAGQVPVGGYPPGVQHPGHLLATAAGSDTRSVVLAPMALRFVARIIDVFVVLLLNIVVNGWFVVQYVREVSPVVTEFQRRLAAGESTSGIAVPSRSFWLQVAILSLAMALWFAYEVPATADTGQTVGKRLLRIKVVGVDGPQPLGVRRAWRRWNPLGLPVLLWGCYGFGLLLQLGDALTGVIDRPLHQTVHDKSAGTIVVQTDPPAIMLSTPPAGPTPPTGWPPPAGPTPPASWPPPAGPTPPVSGPQQPEPQQPEPQQPGPDRPGPDRPDGGAH